MNYANQLYKHQNVKAFKDYVKSYYKDHSILFITYTFKNTFQNSKNLSPLPALTTFIRSLNKAAFNRASKNDKTAKKLRFLCIRETSHQCKVSNMNKADHYHCFLMIPKTSQERFFKRAVVSVETLYYEKLDKDVVKLNLLPKFYKSTNLPVYKNPSLENYDLDVRMLEDIHDVSRAYDYATKSICAHAVTYDLQDIREFESSQRLKSYSSIAHENDDFILF